MIKITEYDLGQVVGADGSDGSDGVGIASISKTSSSGLVDTYTITYTDGDTDTFTVTNGEDGATGQTGATGNGIASITKTGSSGLVDTYTILFTNGNSTTFTVTNGDDATVTIVTSWSGTLSDSKVPSEKLVKNSLPTIQTSWGGTLSDSKVPSEKLVKNSLPTKLSDLTNDSDFIETSSTAGLIKNDGTIMTGGTGSSNYAVGNHTHSSYVSGTKVTSWSSTVSDSNIPSEKLVSDTFDAIEDLIGDAIQYINM